MGVGEKFDMPNGLGVGLAGAARRKGEFRRRDRSGAPGSDAGGPAALHWRHGRETCSDYMFTWDLNELDDEDDFSSIL